ncbi:unnamed protein product [Rotaria sp. Silwood2]|nr:unnamed protein product [Rotaria sp. Silwood2]CAF4437815.1 unnamed protein product [Rotaria sp. Silwood2]
MNFLFNFDDQHVKIGQWQFQANSSLIKSFEITLNTSIHFEHSFNILNTNLSHPGLYPIDTEPIKGSQLYSFIRILKYISQEIIFYELEFIDASNNLLQQYKLIKQNKLIYISKIVIPSIDFFIKIKGKNNRNELIERLYSHKIIPRTLELNVIVDGKSSSYIQSGQKAKLKFILINHNPNTLTVDVKITQTLSIFDIILNKNKFILNSNEIQTNCFELKASNKLTLIDSSSDISIVVKSSLQLNAFNTYTLRTTIISPFNNIQPPICNSLFSSGKMP